MVPATQQIDVDQTMLAGVARQLTVLGAIAHLSHIFRAAEDCV